MNSVIAAWFTILAMLLTLVGCVNTTADNADIETTGRESAETTPAEKAATDMKFVIDREGGVEYRTETTELETENGKLHTVMYIPESGAEKFPEVIFSHGYGDTNRGGRAYAEALAAQGYFVVCFDFRGGGPSSQSDGDPLDMTVFNEIADLESEIDMLKGRADVDDGHIFLRLRRIIQATC